MVMHPLMFSMLNHTIAQLCLTVFIALSLKGQSSAVISQVYGGGGNAGATLRNDFVELFNLIVAPKEKD